MRAHDGPPYPILVDGAAGPVVLSVWADPDVGTGSFYFYVDPVDEGPLPALDLELFVRPRDEERAEHRVLALPAGERDAFQLYAEADFDHRAWWTCRFVVRTPSGADELSVDVEVTPPGSSALALLWFVFPFLAVALLWAKAMLQRRAYHARAE